eukprot:scaffold189286_cov24-Tisochrysis_lutea.AAC.1
MPESQGEQQPLSMTEPPAWATGSTSHESHILSLLTSLLLAGKYPFAEEKQQDVLTVGRLVASSTNDHAEEQVKACTTTRARRLLQNLQRSNKA